MTFPRARVAVMVDGCWWHGCPEHGTLPRANRAWWEAKVARTVARDRRNDRVLAAAGWIVVRTWEHEDPAEASRRIAAIVRDRMKAVTGELPTKGGRAGLVRNTGRMSSSLATFADQVGAFRQAQGLSLRQLADQAHVDVGFLSRSLRVGTGKVPSARLMEKVAEVLGVAPEAFPEYREYVAVLAVRGDPALRDDVFERAVARGAAAWPPRGPQRH